MALITPIITISLEEYSKLLEDSQAFRKLQNDEKFVHYHIWYSFGGPSTVVTSNDHRILEIKREFDIEVKDIRQSKDAEIYRLKEQIANMKLMGFFKRLFS